MGRPPILRPQLRRDSLGGHEYPPSRATMPALLLKALLVGQLVAFVALGVWSWRRLSPRADDQYSTIVYRHGVRGWGVTTWALFSAYALARQADAGLAAMLARGLAMAITFFPIFLWCGYAWGRGMAIFFGVKR